jgi:2-octaprenyl-6-methoxyphenol hydroxylase
MGMSSNNKSQLSPFKKLLYDLIHRLKGRAAMGQKQIDIIILGGGAAGLTLAILLGQSGLSVSIVDPHKPAAFKDTAVSGRTVALMESSLNIIKAAGVWNVLSPHACAMEKMRIFDDSDGKRDPIEIDFPAQDIGAKQFGFNIPNGLLRAALFERLLKTPNVSFIEDSFESFEIGQNDIKITLASKKTITAKMIVGADGRNSAVREFAGITAKVKKYNQAAITCVINHSCSHNNTSTEFHRENGPMALVPLPGNQSSVVWVESPERADALLKLRKSEFEQALQDRTHNVLGGITLEVGPESWPLCTSKAEKLTAPRLALMAEAAHVMSPITAQGLNLSLRDVAALAEVIVDAARLGLDIGSDTVLRGYEKRRRADIETRVFGVDAMNRLVSTHALGLKRLRRAGLRSLDSLPFVKTMAMEVGLAPQMDQGRLAKGGTL